MLFTPVRNSNGKVVLEGKVRLGSVPAERMQIVCSPAEFLMQIGPARKVLHCILRALLARPWFPDGVTPFWKSDS